MNILVLHASGRMRGNTARLDSLFEASLRAEAAEAGTPLELETIALAERDVRFCRGCRSCFDRGEAPALHALRTMQVALWTWGYRVADSLSFATGAEMSGTELQRLHGEKVTRAAKLFQDALHRRFLRPS